MSIYRLKQHPSFYENLQHSAVCNTNLKSHTPYTYLIGWSILDTWYYGCKFGKNCHPAQLFNYNMSRSKRYETSSRHVKNFIKMHGVPDIIKIMQIFDNALSCKRHESKFLNRINAMHNIKFLNETNGEGELKTRAGEKLSIEHKQKMKDNHASTKLGYVNPQKGKHPSAETIERNRLANKPHFEFRKGKTLEELYGVERSNEIKRKHSASKLGDNNPMRNRTPEQIQSRLITVSNNRKFQWKIISPDNKIYYPLSLKIFCKEFALSYESARCHIDTREVVPEPKSKMCSGARRQLTGWMILKIFE